ncbi:MAG: asparagine synthase (glutamine-hydrolyzing) [Candidatus Wallbacteria bacterium]|nr:asparagine synthase (glutamine-hydrolyzing) [Candidatus Wallbacteria bacterium]
MCGIAGLYSDTRTDLEIRGGKMLSVLTHRGPDSGGTARKKSWWFGHRRLSIIDLSDEAGQPMQTADGRFLLVYNGEIYNFMELRAELEKRGAFFRTRSDTEVLLTGLAMDGTAFIPKLCGMFAFAFFDSAAERVILARDRFGIKPLYYWQEAREIAFASEIKALLASGLLQPTAEPSAVKDYLVRGLTDAREETFFRRVKQLPPGSLARIEHGRLSLRHWYDWPVPDPEEDAAEWCLKLRDLLRSSVAGHMVADVDVGSCLSGGIDSSGIVCLMAGIDGSGHRRRHSFSVNFDFPGCSERKFQETVADRAMTDPHYLTFDSSEACDMLPRVVFHQDEPFHSLSMLAQWKVMEAARKQRVVVLLDGQGADELFAGYPSFYVDTLASELRRFRWLRALIEAHSISSLHGERTLTLLRRALRKLFPLKRKKIRNRSPLNEGYFSKAVSELPPPVYYSDPLFAGVSQAMCRTSLPCLLRYEDRNSMAHSIEARVPYLDHRVVEHVFRAPAGVFVKGGVTKWGLREALKGEIPEPVRRRNDKMGFVAPDAHWLTGGLKDLMLSLLDEALKIDIFEQEKINLMAAELRQGQISPFLFRTCCFALWKRIFKVSM